MSYLVVNSNTLNEVTKTIAHNLWTRLIAGAGHDTKKYGHIAADIVSIPFICLSSILTIGGLFDLIKSVLGEDVPKLSLFVGYKASMILFQILAPLGVFYILNNLVGAIVKLDNKYFDSMYSLSNPLKTKLIKWCSKTKDSLLIISEDKKENDILLGKNEKLASKYESSADDISFSTPGIIGVDKSEITIGSMTTSIAYKFLFLDDNDPSKGLYIIYFIFDENKILNVRVLAYDKSIDPSGKDPKGYYVQEIKQWKFVDKKEYLK